MFVSCIGHLNCRHHQHFIHLTFTFLIFDTRHQNKPQTQRAFILHTRRSDTPTYSFLTFCWGTGVGSQTGSALACVVVIEAALGCWLQLLSVWLLAFDCSCWSVVVSLASGSWLQLICCCSEGYSSASDLMQERPSRPPPSAPAAPWSPCVLSLLQHIVLAQAGEIAFAAKYFAKRWGVHWRNQ